MEKAGLKQVLVAFSGGIDSCAAVEILRGEGYHVEALTIDMLGDDTLMKQARDSAHRLGVELHIVDARELFKSRIIDNFVGEYMSGRTPAPCTLCNVDIKWELLADKADELGVFHIATGHYLRIVENCGHLYVAKADDEKKDQSYYLWGVRESILRRVVTPLASSRKAEIKARSVIKRESMGVCFLRGKHYAEYLCNDCNKELSEGDIVDRGGTVVGKHNGIARYTIGQKRGDGIPEGLRIIEIDAEKNQLVAGDNKLLFKTELQIDRFKYTDRVEIENSNEIEVKVRGLGLNPSGFARIEFISDTTATISLENPAWAIAPGQPIVLYIGSRVVGGGYQL